MAELKYNIATAQEYLRKIMGTRPATPRLSSELIAQARLEARPMKARGLTQVTIDYPLMPMTWTQILSADPRRRMVSFFTGGTPCLFAPINPPPGGAFTGYQISAFSSLVFDEDRFGATVQQEWFAFTSGIPENFGLLVEVYLT